MRDDLPIPKRRRYGGLRVLDFTPMARPFRRAVQLTLLGMGALLDFNLTDEQQMLKNLVERFAAERFSAADRPMHETPPAGFNADNWALLAEVGLLALPFSEDDGGLGGGLVEITTVMEAMGRGLVAEPYLSSILLAGQLLARAGDDDQKGRWIAPIMTGEAHLAAAFAEPDSRFNLGKVKTAATVSSGGIVLNGHKTFILAGEATQAYIVSAVDLDGRICLYLIEADAPGLIVQSYRLLDGATAQTLVLNNVAAASLSGGLDALEDVAQAVRIAACAEMLGIMSTLFDVTLEYLKTRKQFGVPIGSFQALQHRMADLYASLEQSRSMVLRAALSSDADRPAATAATKAYVSAAAIKLAEDAVQLHGGMGVSDELIIGHGLKRILVLANLFGDADAELVRYQRLTAA